MKKILYILLIASLSVSSLTGCGKEVGSTDLTGGDDTGNIERSILTGIDMSSSTEEEETDSYQLFDMDPGWKDVTIDDQAIQIDDTLYFPGVSVADFIAQVESSSVKYTYEYNPDKLILSKEGEQIKFYRDGVEWFSVDAVNCLGETTALSKLPVTVIDETWSATKYCYFLDGRTYDDILNLSYEDVKNLNDDLLIGFIQQDEKMEQFFFDREEQLCQEYEAQCGELYRARWTGQSVQVIPHYQFYIDSDTAKVDGFRINHSGTMWRNLKQVVSKLSDLSEENIEELNDHDISEVKHKGKEGTEVFLKGRCIKDDTPYLSENKAYRLCSVYELEKEDGTKTYVEIEHKNISFKPYTDSLTGRNYWDSNYEIIRPENESLDDVMEKYELNKDTVDSNFPS